MAATSAARVATLEAELQAERASQAATAADEVSRAADVDRMVEAAVAAREEEAQWQVAAAQQQVQQVRLFVGACLYMLQRHNLDKGHAKIALTQHQWQTCKHFVILSSCRQSSLSKVTTGDSWARVERFACLPIQFLSCTLTLAVCSCTRYSGLIMCCY